MGAGAATLTTSRILLAGALVLLGCGREPSPLRSLGTITRAEVTYTYPGDHAPRAVVTDPVQLAVLRAAARRAGDWQRTWHTPPAGSARAALYRDSIFLGVLSVGPDFIGVGAGTDARFRELGLAEGESVYVAIGLPPKPK